MSTTLQDLKGGTSICCGAEMYTDLGICSDCKEHSEAEPVCEFNCDEGYQRYDFGQDEVYDQKCACQM